MRTEMTTRQLLVLAAIIFAGLALFGCGRVPTPDSKDLARIAADVNDLIARVDAYQEASTAAVESLAASGELDPNAAAAVVAANEDIDLLQEVVGRITAALQRPDGGDSEGLLTLIETAISVNAATAAWNPYAAVIAAALTVLSAILGVKLKGKANEAAVLGRKYQAHKQGVEKTMKEVSLSEVADVRLVESELYNNIGDARKGLL